MAVVVISLTIAEYEGIRSHPARFAVLPGHVDSKVERVVNGAGAATKSWRRSSGPPKSATHLNPRDRHRLGSGGL